MKNLSVDHAAQIVGVSSATLRNWVKSGHIKPVSSRPLLFQEDAVLHLKNQIGSESFGKLKKRANKVGSANNFLPEEYANNPCLVSHIENITSCIENESLNAEVVIFLAALRFLEINGEVKKDHDGDPFSLESYSSWARQSVKSIMFNWRLSLNIHDTHNQYVHIYELLSPHDGNDFLGLLYQSLFKEGSKSKQGSYYTPSRLVEESLSHIDPPITTFLDPCCGSGMYLLIAAKKFNLKPENIYGADCDRVAANIARLNLLMEFKDEEFTPHIFCIDSLSELATGEIFCETNHLIENVDVVATNPPWGAYKNSARKVHFPGKVKSGETFSMFLEKSIQLLRKGGKLSFILPESIVKIKVHSDIREILLTETKISNIAILGRQFTGVFTPVIRLDLIKECAPDDWLVSVEESGKSRKILQERFKRNDDFTFNIDTSSRDEDLLNKIYSVEHLTLSKKAEWALGIVTGDNKKYVLDEQVDGSEPVLRGGDVFPYRLGDPKSFIRFTPAEFQQVAPERLFRAPEKLIYKFISKKLVFSYDDRQQLTLNSANILIPSIPGMSVRVALAFLNSAVFQYIFEKKFATHKVLRGDLEMLPFPILSVEAHATIERLVDAAIITKTAPKELENLIFDAFRLDESDLP